MRSRLIFLFVAFHACASSIISLDPLDYSSTDCEFPPKFTSIGTDPHEHPYKYVNFNKDLRNVSVFTKELGDRRDYKVEKVLGNGTFGSVFKAIHTPTNDTVALKILLHTNEKEIAKEINIMKELKEAPNFLRLRDVLRDEEDGEVTIGLVSEFFPSKSFSDVLPTLTVDQMKVMIYETMRTLEFAHSRGIMHKDIKPLNVLMNPETSEVRVIDWGQADFYIPGQAYSVKVSTLFYKAPELLLNYVTYDYKIDVWSTACMITEMAFKKDHFFRPDKQKFPPDDLTPKSLKQQSYRGQLDAYAKILGTAGLKAYAEKFGDQMKLDIMDYVGDYEEVPLVNFVTDQNAHLIDPLLIDLLYKMLVYDHTKRVTIKEALEHPYFDDVRID